MWAGPLLLAGVALVFDALNRHVSFGLLSTGPLDEVAHLATAALGLMVLACFADASRRFYVAALVASVAIDLDHIPLYLGINYFVADKYMKVLAELADSPNQKVLIMPMEVTGVLGSLAGIAEIAKATFGDTAVRSAPTTPSVPPPRRPSVPPTA